MTLIRLAFRKVRIMTGGATAGALLLAFAFLMFFTVSSALSAKLPDSLVIAAVDLDKTEVSQELISILSVESDTGLTVRLCDDEQAASALMDSNKVEGMLIIQPGFADGLADGGAYLKYTQAVGASSGEAVCEIVGGKAIRLRSRLRAELYAEQLMGGDLDASQMSILMSKLDELTHEHINSCNIIVIGENIGENTSSSPATVFSATFARYPGFCAFIIMLFLLILGSWLGSAEARASSLRMASLPGGRMLALSSDFLAICGFGMTLGIIMYCAKYLSGAATSAPDAAELMLTLCYIICVSSLAMLLSNLGGATGKINLAAPFIATIASLVGGCFINPVLLPEAISKIGLFTPQGWYLGGLNAKPVIASIVLIAAAGIMLTLEAALRRGRSRKSG